MKEPGYSRGAWYWVLPGADFDNLHDHLRDGHNEDRRDRADRPRHESRYDRRRHEPDRPRSSYQRRGSRDEGRYDDDIPEVEKGGKVEKHDQDEKLGDSTRFWAEERNLPDAVDSNHAESAPFWRDEMNLSDQHSTRGMFEDYMTKKAGFSP
jgi:hypothetical protein